ncbi:MAG: PEGA domain-containing protein [Alphaproteobacteria bacterium]|nr:PEGA domain-containing protein [Alphaproteobacteria bacterium]
MKLKQYLSIASILTLSACGTIFNGGSQDMKFDSNVKGVTVYIDGAKVCKTPCVYPVERRASSFVVMAKKKGYEDQYQTIRSSWSKISFLNLTFVYSWTTDLATGGMWKYDRDGVYIEMDKEGRNTAQIKQDKKDRTIRQFALFNYGELKIEAASHKQGEYTSALMDLTNKDENELFKTINSSYNQVALAHALTGVKQ